MDQPEASADGAGDARTAPNDTLLGASIIAAIKEAGVGTVISVPDITTSEGLLRPISGDAALRHVRVCKEDEGIGISAGLSFCDERALLLIQNTGFLDSLNAVRGVAVEYGLPICLMVGLLGKAPGVAPADADNYGARIVVPILEAMGIDYRLVETEGDVAAIAAAIDAAYRDSRPVVILIGRRPEAP